MSIFSGIFSAKKKQKDPAIPIPEQPVSQETNPAPEPFPNTEDELRRIQAEAEEQIHTIEEAKLGETREAQERLRAEAQARIQELEEMKRREAIAGEQKIREISEAKVHELEEQKMREAREAQEQLKKEAEARMRELEEMKRREAEAEEEHVREMARAKIHEIEEVRRQAKEAAEKKAAEEARRREEEAMRRQSEEAAQRKIIEDIQRAAEEPKKAAAQNNASMSTDTPVENGEIKPRTQGEKPPAPAPETPSSLTRAKAAPRFLEKIQRVSEAGELLAAHEAETSAKTTSQKEHESSGATSFLDRLKKIRDAGRAQPEQKKKAEVLPTGNLDLLNIDLYRTQTEIIVFAQLPGVDMEDLMIFAEKENDVIVIRARQKRPEGFTKASKEAGKFIQEECTWGSLYRQITLPEEVDILESWAKLDKGVLILKLPLLRVRKTNSEKKQIKILG